MSTHRFALGQVVRLVATGGLSPAAAHIYAVEAAMPIYNNNPQYRLWNAELHQRRVASERDLEAVIDDAC
jgi:hypothetical protein